MSALESADSELESADSNADSAKVGVWVRAFTPPDTLTCRSVEADRCILGDPAEGLFRLGEGENWVWAP